MSAGDGRREHRFLETSHYSSSNRGVDHSIDNGSVGYRSQDTIHSSSIHFGVYHFGENVRGGSRYQDTSQSSSHNHRSRFDVDRRGGYMFQTRHYSPHNPGSHGILLSLSVSSCPVDNSFHDNEILKYSGYDKERGDMSGYDDNKR